MLMLKNPFSVSTETMCLAPLKLTQEACYEKCIGEDQWIYTVANIYVGNLKQA